MMKRTAFLLLALALPAHAQWHLNFPTQAACAEAAASVVGPAGGATNCSTSRSVSVAVPIDIRAHGARCDGTTDDHAAITRSIAAAKAKALPVLVPPATCVYSDLITLDGVKLTGKGDASVLYALNPLRAAIVLQGSGSEVRGLRLTGRATTRSAARVSSRIAPIGATKWVIDSVLIDNAAGAGIYSGEAANNGTVSNNRITGTLADAIHITERSSYITITGNTITSAGDDGIAVVSYRSQGTPVHHVIARGNSIADNKGGRGMSVVGGSDVTYEDNRIGPQANACLYLAQEATYDTLAVKNIIARYNTLTSCGTNRTIGHAAVMLFTNTAGMTNDKVTLARNDISTSAVTAIGIRVYGSNTGVVIDSNRIVGVSVPMMLPAEIKAAPYASGAVGVR